MMKKPDLQLDFAAIADLPALTAIYNEAIALRHATGHLEPFTPAQRRAWFAAHDRIQHPLYVARRGAAVAGYATLSAYRGGRGAFRAARELSFFVAAAHLRQGVASALLTYLVADCSRVGVRTLLVFVLEHNRPSREFLAHHGFMPWGRLPQVAEIDACRQDHLILGRDLTGHDPL